MPQRTSRIISNPRGTSSKVTSKKKPVCKLIFSFDDTLRFQKKRRLKKKFFHRMLRSTPLLHSMGESNFL